MAGRIGQLVNLNSLSHDVGVSSTTLAQWLSVLEASFIIYRLYPYYENFGKRLIKSPKIYFTEPGLASYLLDIRSPNDASRDPLIGKLFENMVVTDILKTRFNGGLPANLYFYRDNHGNETDLIFEEQRQLFPIEIKSAMTYHDHMIRNISHFQKLTEKAGKGHLIYSGDFEFESDTYTVQNFKNSSDIFTREN